MRSSRRLGLQTESTLEMAVMEKRKGERGRTAKRRSEAVFHTIVFDSGRFMEGGSVMERMKKIEPQIYIIAPQQ